MDETEQDSKPLSTPESKAVSSLPDPIRLYYVATNAEHPLGKGFIKQVVLGEAKIRNDELLTRLETRMETFSPESEDRRQYDLETRFDLSTPGFFTPDRVAKIANHLRDATENDERLREFQLKRVASPSGSQVLKFESPDKDFGVVIDLGFPSRETAERFIDQRLSSLRDLPHGQDVIDSIVKETDLLEVSLVNKERLEKSGELDKLVNVPTSEDEFNEQITVYRAVLESFGNALYRETKPAPQIDSGSQ